LHYQSIKNDESLIQLLQHLSDNIEGEGFWKFYDRLRLQGHKINHKRVYRIYKQLGLRMKLKAKKRLPARIQEKLEIPPAFTQTWSIDFMSDASEQIKSIKAVTSIPKGKRICSNLHFIRKKRILCHY
jgi:putative transposase